jgi:hypothetical protein
MVGGGVISLPEHSLVLTRGNNPWEVAIMLREKCDHNLATWKALALVKSCHDAAALQSNLVRQSVGYASPNPATLPARPCRLPRKLSRR